MEAYLIVVTGSLIACSSLHRGSLCCGVASAGGALYADVVRDYAAETRALDEARARLVPVFEAGGIREAVARAQALLPEKRRYERIAGVETPWPAEIYLLPELRDPL